MEIEKIDSLKELTLEETLQINGGETLWYWIAYSLGSAVNISRSLRSNPNYANANVYK